jgi:hypothetical protein
MNWDQQLMLFSTIVAAICAVIAAAVSVGVWSKARSSNQRITEGDAIVRAHVDRSLGSLRASIHEVKSGMDAMEQLVARIATRQETDKENVLRPRDLGVIHEKINRVAEQLAETRAQAHTETRLLNEQLKVLQRLIQDMNLTPRSRR